MISPARRRNGLILTSSGYAKLTHGFAAAYFQRMTYTISVNEKTCARLGPARTFLAAHRQQSFLVTVISAGEIAVIFELSSEDRRFLSHFRLLRLTPEIALLAAAVDRD